MPKNPEKSIITKDQALNRAAISLREWCQLTGVSIPSGARYLKSGELEHVKIGNRVLIPSRVYTPLILGGFRINLDSERTTGGNNE
jgi:hypothetical protein